MLTSYIKGEWRPQTVCFSRETKEKLEGCLGAAQPCSFPQHIHRCLPAAPGTGHRDEHTVFVFQMDLHPAPIWLLGLAPMLHDTESTHLTPSLFKDINLSGYGYAFPTRNVSATYHLWTYRNPYPQSR